MIKLKISEEMLIKHKEYIKNKKLYEKLQSERELKDSSGKTVHSPKERAFLKYLMDQCALLDDEKRWTDSIFVATPEKLKTSLEFIKTSHKEIYEECLKEKSEFSDTLLNLLGYSAFSDEAPKYRPQSDDAKKMRPKKGLGEKLDNWCAYAFTYMLGLTVCPYCNRSYINTYWSTSANGKTRPDLDHFISKARHPYFSMSIFNLVPSCKICNSSLKGQKEFSFETHINPYEEEMEDDVVTFSYNASDLPGLIGLSEKDIRIELKFNEDKACSKRLKNNCDVMLIEDLYQNHTNVVCDMIRRKYIYSQDYRTDILKTFDGLFADLEEVNRFVLNAPPKDRIQNSMLGKLRNDIFAELEDV